MASTPKPAASQKVLKRLQQASEQLQLLQSLQVRTWDRCMLMILGVGARAATQLFHAASIQRPVFCSGQAYAMCLFMACVAAGAAVIWYGLLEGSEATWPAYLHD